MDDEYILFWFLLSVVIGWMGVWADILLLCRQKTFFLETNGINIDRVN